MSEHLLWLLCAFALIGVSMVLSAIFGDNEGSTGCMTLAAILVICAAIVIVVQLLR